MSGFITAMRTLTVFPVPGREARKFSDSLFWFPAVGLVLGVLQASAAYLLSFSGWPELAAAAGVLAGTVFTRGMHADGLADVADGFWGGKTKADALRIMKDSSVGAFGVTALAGVLLLKWIAVMQLVKSGSFACIASGVLLARWAQVLLASALPYARIEGGTAHDFVDGAGWPHAAGSSLLVLLLMLVFMRENLLMAATMSGAAVAAVIVTGVKSFRKIGGVTGDVLGAGNELCELVVWISAAFSLSGVS